MKKSAVRSVLMSIALSGLMVISFSACTNDEDELNGLTSEEVQLRSATDASQGKPQFVPNEILVKFKADASSSVRKAILNRVKGQVAEKILTEAMKHVGDNEGILLIKIPMAALDAIGRVKNLVGIEYAELNYIYTIDAISNDPYYRTGSLWGMYGDATTPRNPYGCQAGEAWAKGQTGSGNVYVGIIDQGYMYTHEDLAANAGRNSREIAGDRIDNDRNGYVDDVYGWNFVNNNSFIFDSSGDAHGTHVAGIIGAVGGNGKGVAGVCWSVKFLSGKFLGKFGGTTANAVKAVDYFTSLKYRGINIVATNNSWGGGGYSKALYDAIERANRAGVLFIVAAGNNGRNIDVSPYYPASYTNSNIITVASITSTGAISSFSNYGARSVDIGAPGSAIYSCVPKFSNGRLVSGYANYSGTSMATPHVTGAVALYKSIRPAATVPNIITAIKSSTVATPSLSGRCVTGGRLNVGGF